MGTTIEGRTIEGKLSQLETENLSMKPELMVIALVKSRLESGEGLGSQIFPWKI